MPGKQGRPNKSKDKPLTEQERRRANDPNHGTKSTPQKRGGITVWPKRPQQ